MGITTFYDSGKEYFRITRTWNRIMRQEYVPVEKNRNKAYKKAKEIDDRLIIKQKAFENLMAISKEGYFREDGSIIGISKYKNCKKGCKTIWYFRLQITLTGEDKPRRYSANIDHIGIEKAHGKVVGQLCEWKGISKSTNLYKALLEGVSFYKEKKNQQKKHLKDNCILSMERKLNAQVKEFKKSRHVIRC